MVKKTAGREEPPLSGERLHKFLAGAGISSRRAAEEMIRQGRVSVNEQTVREMGFRVRPGDEIRVDGLLVGPRPERVYLMLNKPRGYVTTLNDPQGRPIVTDLIPEHAGRVFPVGRLDYESEGLLLLTNDGDWAYRLQHPRFRQEKTYLIKLKGNPSASLRQRLEKGWDLDDGPFRPVRYQIGKVNNKSWWLEITINEGRNRILRRAFAQIQMPVVRLIRTAVGRLTLAGLAEGQSRFLTPQEAESCLNAEVGRSIKKYSKNS
ncbi:MAG TPA: pseudouridine synthase [Syntrophales bacterium]|nr:pseudouridine synthase [Syntrophales bacterium]HOU77207.1 pseudouridine synthase [Syntrophales bacterium]HPC32028.1 pseudouridine synthase [Syntrophales bacterium]HQG33775.1 pseudouridine synthase [Syntrophales bacterium]HQI35217.1 pseudouridine synthase [Syntrophales bacterium]